MKNLIILLISIFFSVQVLAQTDSQEVAPTDETSKTNLSGEYIYASSYFKKSKTGIVLKYAPTLPTVFYGCRFIVYNTEKFFIGGTGFTGQLGGPKQSGTFQLLLWWLVMILPSSTIYTLIGVLQQVEPGEEELMKIQM